MTLNMLNFAKICRICLAEGARNIFDRKNYSTQSGGGVECVASLENLLEKMRYVTMAQVKDNDTLPKMICDTCIVQLNVSYNFKRKAVENDLKLRQYVIEKGLDTTTDENNSGAPTLYYTSNISIMQNNSDNIEHNFNSNAIEINATVINTEQTGNAVINEQDVPEKQISKTIPHPIPIKLELIESSTETDCNSRFIPESNLPNPNLMVVVNDNNALLPQSISSSNSTSTMPSSGSSSFTNENNLRDSEFLRNYVQNKINFEGSQQVTKSNAPAKIDRRYKAVRKMLHSKREKFLKKHIKKNLSNTSGSNKSSSKTNFKVSVDLRNLILDQKENFSSALKMRNHNKKLFYTLRHNQQKSKKIEQPKKEMKQLKKG